MAHLSAELLANPENPRKITQRKLETLSRTLREFGDLGGVIKNVSTGESDGGGLLIGGHQRVAVLQADPNAEVVITKHYDEPTVTGTVAEGYILSLGESYAYREVMWDRKKATAASIAANNNVGEWDEHALVDLMQQLQAADYDLDLTLFDDEMLECLLPDEPVDIAPDAPEPKAPQGSPPTRPDAPKPEPEAPDDAPDDAEEEATTEPAAPPQLKRLQLVYEEDNLKQLQQMVCKIEGKQFADFSEPVMRIVHRGYARWQQSRADSSS